MKFPAHYYKHPKYCQITLGKKERKDQLIFLGTLRYLAIYFKFATLKIIMYILILNKNEYVLIFKSIWMLVEMLKKLFVCKQKKKQFTHEGKF